ncbi:hypothetical protein BJV77DRAFT_1069738 [Russula vinacea]|nr:hypothetical protein BJV77DRAFT_1069738 [Russula vinacea]
MSPLPLSNHQDLNSLLEYPLKLCAATTLATYVISVVTGNVSQVDRVWTFMPTIYTAYWALLPCGLKQRNWRYLAPYVPEEASHFARDLALVHAHVGSHCCWMFRLSYHAWRRGFYRLNEEDYRWAVLRNKIPSWLFQIVNLTFISLRPTRAPWLSDGVLLSSRSPPRIRIHRGNQQYAYQRGNTGRTTRARTGRAPASRGPRTTPPWFLHARSVVLEPAPEFFAEQSFWGVLNLIPLIPLRGTPALASVDESALNEALCTLVPLSPSLALCLLFICSTRFTEVISASKYREATPHTVNASRCSKREVEELVWGSGAREAEAKTGKGRVNEIWGCTPIQ